MEALREFLVEELLDAAQKGSSSLRVSFIRGILERPDEGYSALKTDELFSRLPNSAAEELREAMKLPRSSSRLAVYRQAEREVRRRKKEIRKKFAQEQFLFLEEKGLSGKAAQEVMKAAGPGQVQEAWQLAESWLDSMTFHDPSCPSETIRAAARVILSGLEQEGFGVERTSGVLAFLKLAAPSRSGEVQKWVLAGVREIIHWAGEEMLFQR